MSDPTITTVVTPSDLLLIELRLREQLKDLEDRLYKLERAQRFSQGFFDLRVDL